MTKNIESLAKYNVRSNDINKIQNILKYRIAATIDIIAGIKPAPLLSPNQ